jgi:hypothetical protein
MRLTASRVLLITTSSLLLWTYAMGRSGCKCVCRPSPPGGTTICNEDEMAICSGTASGECEGRCVKLSQKTNALGFASEAITAVLKAEKEITEADLLMEKATGKTRYARVIRSILESANSDKTVALEGRRISIGLSNSGQDKLKSALDRLK